MASVKGEKIWADAIRKAVKGYMEVEDEPNVVKKVRVLNRLADTLCKSAARGDIGAMKEVGDRLDGKPTQALEVQQKVTLVDILGRDWNGGEDAEAMEDESGGLRDRSVKGHA